MTANKIRVDLSYCHLPTQCLPGRDYKSVFLVGHASSESGQCTYRSSDGSLSAYQLMQKNDDDVYEEKKKPIGESIDGKLAAHKKVLD